MKHKKEIRYGSTTERIAKGAAGFMLAATGLVYGLAVGGDGAGRMAEAWANAPVESSRPIHDLAADITPDFVVEPIHGVMSEGGFGITELGVGIGGIAVAMQGTVMAGRAMRRPEQDLPRHTRPPQG